MTRLNSPSRHSRGSTLLLPYLVVLYGNQEAAQSFANWYIERHWGDAVVNTLYTWDELPWALDEAQSEERRHYLLILPGKPPELERRWIEYYAGRVVEFHEFRGNADPFQIAEERDGICIHY